MTRRVLIFEDNKNLQFLLRLFFQKRGIVPMVADDAVDAVALASQHRPDIILMDLVMPEKDGLEAVSELRRAAITAFIVMFTSNTVAANRERALAAGADAYLVKPFNPDDLQRLVEV